MNIFIKLIMNNVIVIYLIGSSIIYSVSSGICGVSNTDSVFGL